MLAGNPSGRRRHVVARQLTGIRLSSLKPRPDRSENNRQRIARHARDGAANDFSYEEPSRGGRQTERHVARTGALSARLKRASRVHPEMWQRFGSVAAKWKYAIPLRLIECAEPGGSYGRITTAGRRRDHFRHGLAHRRTSATATAASTAGNCCTRESEARAGTRRMSPSKSTAWANTSRR